MARHHQLCGFVAGQELECISELVTLTGVRHGLASPAKSITWQGVAGHTFCVGTAVEHGFREVTRITEDESH